MKRIVLIFVSICIVSLCYAQNQVVPINETYHQTFMGDNTFYYMLPQTAFQVNVTITKTKEMKGYYGEYAEKLLGLTNIIANNKTSYKLKNISVSPIILPDSNQIYAVELSADQKKNQFLSKLYQTPANLIIDPVIYPNYTVASSSIPDFFRNYADLAYTETDDSFVETRIIDGVVTQVPINKTKMVSKTMAQQAQEAADFIAKIRKDRYDILSGIHEIPYSGDAFAYMVEQLNQLEQNYLSLFTGFTIEEEEAYTLIVTPEGDENISLFSIDSENGLSRSLSIRGEQNYYLSVDPQIGNSKYIQFEYAKNRNNKKGQNKGYRFRKPVPAFVSLIKNDKSIYSFGFFNMYQLGKIEILPAGLDDFNISEYAIIY